MDKIMKIDIIEISGFASALAGLRKPFKGQIKTTIFPINNYDPEIHEEDYKLMLKLVKAGDEHAKCIRGIRVTADVVAPRYFWSEHDTYRIGSDSLSSESTMHTILKDGLALSNFDSHGINDRTIEEIISNINSIKDLEELSNSEKTLLIKEILPESFIQTRTIQYSYQALRRIYFQRKNHRLPIWREFCDWIETLPMSELITGKNE